MLILPEKGYEEHKTIFFDVDHIVTFFGDKSPISVKPTNNIKFVVYNISTMFIGPHEFSYRS